MFNRGMTTADLTTLATRLIKHMLRIAVANRSPIAGMAEGLQPFGDALRKEWFDTLATRGKLDAQARDELSIVVNEAYVNAVRQMRETTQATPMFLEGLADFQANFDATDLLPKQVQA